MRAALASALFISPDLLLLDEVIPPCCVGLRRCDTILYYTIYYTILNYVYNYCIYYNVLYCILCTICYTVSTIHYTALIEYTIMYCVYVYTILTVLYCIVPISPRTTWTCTH